MTGRSIRSENPGKREKGGSQPDQTASSWPTRTGFPHEGKKSPLPFPHPWFLRYAEGKEKEGKGKGEKREAAHNDDSVNSCGSPG